MAWYWYLTGVITTMCLGSLLVNIAMITGVLRVESRHQYSEKMQVLYNWADDSGPISRAG